jgi:hypothetical protein
MSKRIKNLAKSFVKSTKLSKRQDDDLFAGTSMRASSRRQLREHLPPEMQGQIAFQRDEVYICNVYMFILILRFNIITEIFYVFCRVKRRRMRRQVASSRTTRARRMT